jgi:hypothetical protein
MEVIPKELLNVISEYSHEKDGIHLAQTCKYLYGTIYIIGIYSVYDFTMDSVLQMSRLSKLKYIHYDNKSKINNKELLNGVKYFIDILNFNHNTYANVMDLGKFSSIRELSIWYQDINTIPNIEGLKKT